MISLFSKKEYLQGFSEDDFRDQVLRPLFLRKGLEDGRDLCGPLEQGKDCIFVYTDPLGDRIIYAVQTKATNLSMASDPNKNLLQAVTQVKMMLETDILLLNPGEKRRPTKVFLCTSGKINDPAKQHIIDNVKHPNIEFRDIDDLIPEIDRWMPEFWLGVAANKSPYLKSLHESLNQLETLGTTEINWCPIQEDSFIQLRINRLRIERKKVKGKYFTEEVSLPKFEEFPITKVPDLREPRILLVADAGMGKTTSLRRLASAITEQSMQDIERANIPILVRAPLFSRSELSTIDYLSNHTAEVSSVSAPAFGVEELEAGRVTLLIDALDEIPTQDGRQSLLHKLIEFSSQYPDCKIVVTSRNHIWLNELDGVESFERFRISPISWDQTTKLVRRLQTGRGLSEEQALEFMRRLEQVHGFDLNPLVVTLFLASVDADRTDIPANITELFKKFTEVMLGRWDESKGFAQLHQAPLKDFLLRRIAVRMHKEKLTSIPLEGLKGVLFEELRKRRVDSQANIEQLVEEIVYRSGLFKVLGEEVEFKHLMLQEFFAGRGLADGELQDLLGDPWWQRCIVFHFGEHPGNFETFEGAVDFLKSREGDKRMQAALTLGLSLQACYLMTLDEKAILYSDVIDAMGQATYETFAESADSANTRVVRFVMEYVLGRDSATCDILRMEGDSIENLLFAHTTQSSEYKRFWYIAGLIEAGMFQKALEHIKTFAPNDMRILAAFSLGVYLYERIRISGKTDRYLAQEIRKHLEPKVAPLRGIIQRELMSELLELRNGEVKALPDTQEGNEVTLV
jgi:hypothetical protein